MTVLLATGGSGGHIFPALQTGLELKRRGHLVVFAGVLDMASAKINDLGFTCHNTGAKGFKDKSLIGVIRFGYSMTMAIARSIKILRVVKPKKVIGFGGYGSFPLVLAAKLCGIPTMIQEQNVVPGKANRVLSKMVNKVAVTFKDSLKYFDQRKTVWTGCPCHDTPSDRPSHEIYKSLGLSKDKLTIALLGGSQGSVKLNEVFFEAMSVLGAEANIQAIHMTGKNEYEKYAKKYAQENLPVVATSFISPIEELYSIVDIVVARCGAATVFELGAFCIPSVLIPYPLAGGHQKYNGQVLEKATAAILIDQKDLTAVSLQGALKKLREPGFSRQDIKVKIDGLFLKEPALRLADALEAL